MHTLEGAADLSGWVPSPLRKTGIEFLLLAKAWISLDYDRHFRGVNREWELFVSVPFR